MVESTRNLAALLTPPGVGAIAVVRLHGPAVPDFLAACFTRPLVADRCVHGTLHDGENVIDDPVVVLAADGHSVDINLHGGVWMVQACLDVAKRHGFSIVENPQTPLPGFMVDAVDELEGEILGYLPLAVTDTAVRVLLAQSSAWRRLDVQRMRVDDRERLLADRSLHWLLHPPRVAIVGIPNAGKSTLANQLFGQQRSITADLPGTTRDWIGETANLDGLAITLVDTPGIRRSDDTIEAEAIGRAERQIESADAILLVLDATRLDDQSQRDLLVRFPGAIVVLNKSDAAPASPDEYAIQTVATRGDGMQAVRSAVRRLFDCEPIDMTAARCWTPRQREVVREAMTASPAAPPAMRS